tara:strand:+ start:610 stop:975 length:366 start_codon:yes stop_codon:yes gene_type:complete
MTLTPMLLELGMGSSLRSGSYTKAACRAVNNAIRHNSINLAEVFGAKKSDMIIHVEVACNKPAEVDLQAVASEFPYGTITASAVPGGLDIPNAYISEANPTIIAHAAVRIALDLCKIEHEK